MDDNLEPGMIFGPVTTATASQLDKKPDVVEFEENPQEDIRALDRWLIREAIRGEVRAFLSKHDASSTSETSLTLQNDLMSKVMAKLVDFPPFRGDARMKNSIAELFKLSPRLDTSLKARGGTTSLERFFVSLIASPIVSSSRLDTSRTDSEAASEGYEPNGGGNTFAFASVRLMKEVLSESNGVVMVLEEIKTAHSVSELRPTLRAFFQTLADNMAVRLLRNMRRKPKEFRDNLRRIPRQTLIGALKIHAGGAATSAAVHILFARPFGVRSFWQRFMAEAVKLNSVISEYDYISASIPERCRAILQAKYGEILLLMDPTGHPSISYEPDVIRARRNLVAQYLEREHGIVFQQETDKWAALRMVELCYQRAGLETLVEVIGLDEFTGSLRAIFSSSKSRLSESLLAKGSGFVKLVEVIFECIDKGVLDAERIQDEDELIATFKRSWAEVEFRLFNVMHNVLLNDQDMVVHETIQWLVDAYKGALQLNLPTWDALREGLSEEMLEKLNSEARQVRLREFTNLNRSLGTAKIPPLSLPVANKLVENYARVIREEVDAFAPRQVNIDQLIYLGLRDSSSSSAATTLNDKKDYIVDIEVSWMPKQEESLRRRGYEKCGGTRSSAIWIRRATRRDGILGDCRPIKDVQLTLKTSTGAAERSGWVVIPRNLTKGTFGAVTVYLTYVRSETPRAVDALLDVRLMDDDLTNRLPDDNNWQSAGTFRSGLLQESRMWILRG